MQHQYAEVAMEIEAARLLVYNAARMKDANLPIVKEAAMAKLYSSRVSGVVVILWFFSAGKLYSAAYTACQSIFIRCLEARCICILIRDSCKFVVSVSLTSLHNKLYLTDAL